MQITHPIERARLLQVLDLVSLRRDPEWLMQVGKGVNPFPYSDERFEPTQTEIERQECVRASRERKKEGRHG